MRLSSLFENDSSEIINDYLLLNTLYGTFGKADRDSFLRHYEKEKAETGKFNVNEYIEKMPAGWKTNFRENEHLNDYQISGNEVKFDLSFSLYIYDFAGPPPFILKRGHEIYEFAIYRNCSKLTEYPSWFPSEIYRYQQVGTSIKSFKNITKVIKECVEMHFGFEETLKDVSYLAGIQHLKFVAFDGNSKLDRHVNKYLDETSKEGRDIFDLHSYLIDNGMEEFA